MKKNAVILITASLALLTANSFAQTFPDKPIRLIVPFAPGGTTDVVARLISEPLSRQLGQSIVVDNKPGSGGVLGTQEVLRARPDGYTLAMATPSTTAANPAINPKIRYRPEDINAIVNVIATPNVLAVNPSFPAKTFQDFVKVLNQYPNRYAYASSGAGGILHLQMENIKALTETSMIHIPYRGAGPALVDTVSGQTQIVFDSLPSISPHLIARKLIPIAVASPSRLASFPDVPTFSELGLDEVNRMGYFGIIGPKGMSKDLVEKINLAVKRSLNEPRVKKYIEENGSFAAADTPEKFSAAIEEEFNILKNVVRSKNLTLEQ